MGFAQVTAKPRRVKHLQVAMPVPLVKAMQQVESPAQRVRAPKASQPAEPRQVSGNLQEQVDRKSTRLNSSHSQISYAVFCLKKKKKHERRDGSAAGTGQIAHMIAGGDACLAPERRERELPRVSGP